MFLNGTYGPTYKPKGPTGNQSVLIGGVKYKKKEVAGLFDDDFILSYNQYLRFKRYGLPFSGGWAEQPGIILDTLDIWETAENGRNTKTAN